MKEITLPQMGIILCSICAILWFCQKHMILGLIYVILAIVNSLISLYDRKINLKAK